MKPCMEGRETTAKGARLRVPMLAGRLEFRSPVVSRVTFVCDRRDRFLCSSPRTFAQTPPGSNAQRVNSGKP